MGDSCLTCFLLDMGQMVAKNFKDAIRASRALLAYAVVSPFVHAGLALGLSWVLGLPVADAALLMVLSASASYILVPAVLRYAIPEANPAICFRAQPGADVSVELHGRHPALRERGRACAGGGMRKLTPSRPRRGSSRGSMPGRRGTSAVPPPHRARWECGAAPRDAR